MADAEASSGSWSADHVVVIIVREFRAQAVRGLGRLAMADAVTQDDEVFCRIKQSAGGKRTSAELGAEELFSIPPVPCMIRTALSICL